MKILEDQGFDDDTALEDIDMRCKDSGSVLTGGGDDGRATGKY